MIQILIGLSLAAFAVLFAFAAYLGVLALCGGWTWAKREALGIEPKDAYRGKVVDTSPEVVTWWVPVDEEQR